MRIIWRALGFQIALLLVATVVQVGAPAIMVQGLFIPLAHAQNYNCESPPADEPDGDGDECTQYKPEKNKNDGGCQSNSDTNGTPNTSCGNPINFGTGNKYQPVLDFKTESPFPLQIARFYDSQDIDIYAFGAGWHGMYSRSIDVVSSTTVNAVRDDGRVLTFTLQNGSWTPDGDVNSRLKQTSTGWTYTTGDDWVETYDSQGKLLTVANRAGLTQTLGYDSQGNVTSITGPFGRQLELTYKSAATNGYWLVSAVTVPDGGVYQYRYDTKDNLTAVEYPDGSKRQYLYEDSAFPHALTGIIDANGNRFATYTYNSNGFATSTQHAGGANKFSVDYSYFNLGYVNVTNPLGASYAYYLDTIKGLAVVDSVNRSCTDCGGGYGSYATATTYYDANGNVSSRVDYKGYTTSYTYDLSRNLQTSRTDPTGRTVSTTWDPTYRLPTKIVEPNRTTTFNYDSHGNLLTKTVSDGSSSRTWTYTYNANGQVLSEDGPRTGVADITTFVYDSQGNLVSAANALGQTIQINQYDPNGRPLVLKDPNGLLTRLSYNFRGQITKRDAGGEMTTYGYDPVGNLVRLTRPDGSFLNFSYDKAHRLVGVTDALGNRIVISLDAAGNRTGVKVYDPSGKLTRSNSTIYNQLNQLEKLIDAFSDTTQFVYDNNGNQFVRIDPLGNISFYYYDALNRLTQKYDPNQQVTYFGYDNNNHLAQVTDPRSLATSYGYDGFDDQITTTSPDTGTTSRGFDAAGNMISSTDARGDTTTYAYDALNRVVQETFADGRTTQYEYDQGPNGIGHLTRMTDPSGSTVWTYDQHGRVLTKRQTIGPVSLTTSMTYDSVGRLATMTYPSGRVLSLSYNANGQVGGLVANGVPLAVRITYQPLGQVSGWLAGNGTLYQRNFDLAGRIATIRMLSHFAPYTSTFSYDAASRLEGISNTAFPAGTALPSKVFTYDALNRLTGYSMAASSSEIYGYDADGNRSSQSGLDNASYLYDGSSNRLFSKAGAATTTYSYDAAGNTTAITEPSSTKSFTYDARGRMVDSDVDGNITHYLINGLGQRVSKSGWGARQVPGGAIDFVYDGAGHLMGEYDGSGKPIEETVWLGNLPAAILMPSQQPYFVYPDHLGAPRKIASRTGQIVWSWNHDPFGDGQPTGSVKYNLRYPGQYYDEESGLFYNTYRNYDPRVGRYISSDPTGLAGGINSYLYAYGNPLQFSDSLGLGKGGERVPQKQQSGQQWKQCPVKTSSKSKHHKIFPKKLNGDTNFPKKMPYPGPQFQNNYDPWPKPKPSWPVAQHGPNFRPTVNPRPKFAGPEDASPPEDAAP